MTTSITVDSREGLIAHIEGLQVTLSKRNETIAKLKDDLGLAENGEPQQKALNKAYRDGFRAATMAMERLTREAALALGQFRKDAIDLYHEGEKL